MPKQSLKLLFLSAILSGVTACRADVAPVRAESANALSTASLVNTRWRLVAIDGATAWVAPARAEASLTLVLGGDRVRGSTGCNDLTARYQQEADGLRFTHVITGTRVCESPLAEQERRFIQTLSATRRWKIEGETLELLDDEGRGLARFESLYLR
jgi:heat shock protein HslJ